MKVHLSLELIFGIILILMFIGVGILVIMGK
jgi:hypothetical protein